MDQIDGQLVCVILIVASALFFLTRRTLRFFKQRPGCGGGSCTGCDASAAPSPNFVSLDQIKRPE